MQRSRLIVIAAILLLAQACRRDGPAWEAELAAANASRLAGLWTIRLLADRGPGIAEGARSKGEIAFTLNHERLPGKGLDRPPMLFGTYSIDFTPLGLGAGSDIEVPDAVSVLRGDSVTIILGPESAVPIALRGVLTGDSLAGRWETTTRRSSAAASGKFILTRP